MSASFENLKKLVEDFEPNAAGIYVPREDARGDAPVPTVGASAGETAPDSQHGPPENEKIPSRAERRRIIRAAKAEMRKRRKKAARQVARMEQVGDHLEAVKARGSRKSS